MAKLAHGKTFAVILVSLHCTITGVYVFEGKLFCGLH